MNDRKWLVIAHRGASAHAPENTIEAFELAAKQGADYIELDVWQTADDELVVVHDSKLPDKSRRTVKDVTHDELVTIYKEHRNIEVPTLEKVLQRLQNKIKFDIEVKFHGKEKDILALVSSYLDREDYIITSFFPKVLKTFSHLDKTLTLGYLMHPFRPHDWIDGFTAKKAVALQCNLVLPYWLMTTRRLIKKYRQKNIQCWTWVVNDKNKMVKFTHDGVTGIITDDPLLANSVRETS